MSIVVRLIAFECKQRLRLISTYVYALILAAGGALMVLGTSGVFRGLSVSVGSERVFANSPYSVFVSTINIALYGLFTIAAVFGQAVYRDFEYQTWPIIFSKNVGRREYLLGRFLGAFVFSALLFLVIGFAEWISAVVVSFIRPERVGPNQLSSYLWPYVVQVWPMLFFAGAVFFSLAALTRRMATVYVGVVVLVLGYLVAQVLMQDIESWTTASLVDPFGFIAARREFRYWTPVERNRDLVSVTNLLGANRVLWCAIGAAFLAIAIRAFRPGQTEQRATREAGGAIAGAPSLAYPRTQATPSLAAWVRATLAAASAQTRETLRSAIFWAFALSGFAFLMIVYSQTKTIYGTATWPVTFEVIENARNAFRLFALITITVYAGELVYRERDAGVQDVVDATPVPTWVLLASKLLALWAIAASLVFISACAALIGQVTRGYFAIDFSQYVVQFGVLEWSQLALLCVLAITLQVLCNHKYLGHFAMVIYYAQSWIFSLLGVEEALADFPFLPDVPYSDMNGYGGMFAPLAWFALYWSAFSVLLLGVAYLFYPRGRESGVRARSFAARLRFGRGWQLASLAAALVFAASGSFLFYQTHVAQPYETAKDNERQRAEYERRYKATWQNQPQPRIIDARASYDVHPEAPRVDVRGVYRIRNTTASAIARVFVGLQSHTEVRTLKVAGAERPSVHDETHGVRIFDLPKPLAPNAEADLEFDLGFDRALFRHGGPRREVAGNGTFVNNFDLPGIGYFEKIELTRDDDRKEYGLKPKQKMASRDDVRELQHNYLRSDSDYIHVATEVSTSLDQIALAPGSLASNATTNGRRTAKFVLDTPVMNFFSVLSARYAVKRDTWRDVALEIYYHPAHTFNLDRMMRGMKDALEYCSTAFGPYEHKVLRIVEFPRYQTFAQAFPNTVPYSESIGFIARVRDQDPDDINYPYYVTAHEVAHQWWAHQVIGANVRGATMLSESLAQYSALMVMKKAYDAHHMRRFLRFELDRYLQGRATERERELPLALNENQSYIHYSKGSLAMYALQDYIGQDRVDRALQRFLEAWKYRGPPYATSADLEKYLREETPPEYLYLIDDLFETITLYDNRAPSATVKKAADGSWDVSLKVVTRKFRSDEHGAQTDLDFSDYMDIGALGSDGEAIFIERRKLPKGESVQQFRVSKQPAKVGVDPLNKLIDRRSDDNVVAPTSE